MKIIYLLLCAVYGIIVGLGTNDILWSFAIIGSSGVLQIYIITYFK